MSKRKPTFNHGDKETRYRKACERLGSEAPHCLLCGEPYAHALELHHVAGREFLDELIAICLNHHAKLSNGQKDHPPKIKGCINSVEKLSHLLLGLSDLCGIAADELRDPVLCEFLLYMRLKLKESSLLLIEIARREPAMDFGLSL